GDKRRGGEAEDLPEGKVPGHDGQDGPERVEADVAAARVGPAGLRGEELLGVLGVVLAAPGALLDLPLALRDRLSHLERHGAGVRGLLRAQHARRIADRPCTLLDRPSPTVEEGMVDVLEDAFCIRRSELCYGIYH